METVTLTPRCFAQKEKHIPICWAAIHPPTRGNWECSIVDNYLLRENAQFTNRPPRPLHALLAMFVSFVLRDKCRHYLTKGFSGVGVGGGGGGGPGTLISTSKGYWGVPLFQAPTNLWGCCTIGQSEGWGERRTPIEILCRRRSISSCRPTGWLFLVAWPSKTAAAVVA